MPNSILTVTAPTAAKPTYAERSRIFTCMMEFGFHLLEIRAERQSRKIDESSSQWSHIFFDAGGPMLPERQDFQSELGTIVCISPRRHPHFTKGLVCGGQAKSMGGDRDLHQGRITIS